jgi:NADPH:quinone reductase-like Zn-dependent oxidoreductase
MRAAIVEAFDEPPRYAITADPLATSETESVLEVIAAGLHPIVRALASGSHYRTASGLPFIPGVDGVARDDDRALWYFSAKLGGPGSMADRAVVDRTRSVKLPIGTDARAIAAGMNPALSSWVALRRRIDFQPGQRVLVFGATGSAGRLAVQVATRFGAAAVTAAGRDPRRLAALEGLGATALVSLAGTPAETAAELVKAAADVDVVLDYTWGQPAAIAMSALARARSTTERALTWLQVGESAGATAALPAAALRSSKLHILGSGQGTVSAEDVLAELPSIAGALSDGSLSVGVRAIPLKDVRHAWADAADAAARIVLEP